MHTFLLAIALISFAFRFKYFLSFCLYQGYQSIIQIFGKCNEIGLYGNKADFAWPCITIVPINMDKGDILRYNFLFDCP